MTKIDNTNFGKSRKFRSRKTNHKEERRDQPRHAPYVRCPTNKAALEEEIAEAAKADHLNILLGDWNANP